jgi:hypothetical protein
MDEEQSEKKEEQGDKHKNKSLFLSNRYKRELRRVHLE